jgi:hypothetical protein
MPLSQGTVGPVVGADGSLLPSGLRQGRLADLIVSELHGRFYEQAFRGNLFSGGMTLTSISNATFSTGTLGPTATPIVGVWNPLTSGKNLVILQVRVSPINTALQTTGAGSLMWASSVGNGALTLGSAPMNRLTGLAAGSVAKDMSGIALTGLTNNLVVRDATMLCSGAMSNLSTLQTAAGLMPAQNPTIDPVDGAWIVPPGGVLAVLCTTNPPVAISAASSILWEEVPAA